MCTRSDPVVPRNLVCRRAADMPEEARTTIAFPEQPNFGQVIGLDSCTRFGSRMFVEMALRKLFIPTWSSNSSSRFYRQNTRTSFRNEICRVIFGSETDAVPII